MVMTKENSISTNLKKYREIADMTQGDLAKELGVSRQSVISLEAGRCVPSVALALRIANFFNMPVEFVFRDNNITNNDGGDNMAREIMPWSPLREMMSMRDSIDKFFDEPPGRAVYYPTVGIRETDDHMIIEADVPGVREEDIDIEIKDDQLVIKGERKHSEETKREDYYLLESTYGSFSRVVALPNYVDAEKAEAEIEEGILKIKFPKIEKKKAKKLEVKKKKKE